ncbi:MAG: hypothetical protein ACOC6F_02975 [bacterium]
MSSYREQVIHLLHERPELADQPHEIAERVGCSIKTVTMYVQAWEETKDIVWVLDRIRPTTACHRCKDRDVCEVLDALELPLLCERAPESELLLAELNDTTDLLLASRGIGIETAQ